MSNTRLAVAAAAMLGFGLTQAMAQLSPTDKTFATKAAAGGLAEVELGQLAVQKGSSPQVKQFGQQMITDHGQANQELQQIAQQANLTLPAQPESSQRAKAQQLRATSGAAFDTAYMQDMLRDHQQDVADFRREADGGKDPALKAFAQKYLPVLQKHLQMAQAVSGRH